MSMKWMQVDSNQHTEQLSEPVAIAEATRIFVPYACGCALSTWFLPTPTYCGWLRNPLRHHRSENLVSVDSPGKYQPTMVSTMVSKWCETDFAHPQYVNPTIVQVVTPFCTSIAILSAAAYLPTYFPTYLSILFRCFFLSSFLLRAAC